MKNGFLILLILLSAVIGSASAQRKPLTFGVKAGLNFSNANDFLGSVKDGSITGRTDFTGGILLELRPISVIGISGELLYSGQGYKAKGSYVGADFEQDVKLHYINIPIMAKFYLLPFLSVNAGVQYGINVGANVDVKGMSIKPEFKTSSFGIPVGASVKLGPLLVDARYTFGVSNISKDSALSVLRGDVKSSIFTVSLGVCF
ncbi:hypothetical protein BN938_2146 [Mucinivorans hirudinis]|uniref:Outer membrane protein beta-barrel domain-containing protein n=1 Tax=Mucinivorans hirudinis TaxID=1433126 RepID=A0A060RDY5_9BACT|nr:hypothetical protein BN938_2146 [Mucinivorans hirudinis]